jgi:drug/metabolite transporter (DMT)-like permease
MRSPANRLMSAAGTGTALCLVSAAGFGAMGILGKLAYDEGATVGTLLSARFTLAAALFWALGAAAEVRSLARRDVAIALGLGLVGYAAQAGAYFAALDRIDPGLLALLVYTYPAIVAVAAVALRRERMDARRLAALVLASGGLVLVLGAAGTGQLDPVGAALGMVAALVYSAYILVSEGVAGRIGARVLAALVCSGAAVTLTAGAAVTGQLRPEAVTAAGWGWLACLAVVSTVGAISLFFAGLARVGPTAASILSTAEPVVAVLLAFLVLGDVLEPAQLVGGALVVSGVLVLRGRAPSRIRRRRRRDPAGARTAEERPPHAGETGAQRGEELAQRVEGSLMQEDGLDLGHRARAGLVAPGDVQVLAADDLGQVRGQDDVGVRVVGGQM